MMVDVKTQNLLANVFWNSLCPHLFVCEKLTFLFGIQELSILVVFGPGAKCAKVGQVCQDGASVPRWGKCAKMGQGTALEQCYSSTDLTCRMCPSDVAVSTFPNLKSVKQG